MENFKQIIYREEDQVIMIIPDNSSVEIVPRFLKDLPVEDASKFEDLKTLCINKVGVFYYLVTTRGSNILDLELENHITEKIDITSLTTEEIGLIRWISTYCTNLINN